KVHMDKKEDKKKALRLELEFGRRRAEESEERRRLGRAGELDVSVIRFVGAKGSEYISSRKPTVHVSEQLQSSSGVQQISEQGDKRKQKMPVKQEEKFTTELSEQKERSKQLMK